MDLIDEMENTKNNMTSIEKLKKLQQTPAIEKMIAMYNEMELDVLIDKWLNNPTEKSLPVLLASIDCMDELESLSKITNIIPKSIPKLIRRKTK